MLTERTPQWQKAHWLSIAMMFLMFLSALVALALPHSGVWGAERSARVQVDYTASSLSVESHHVSVQDVLVAMGDHVGFQVVIIGELNSPVIHFSIHEASVEDVLDTLLRGRNYGVSYQSASATSGHGIDKMVVLGSPESEGAMTSRVVPIRDHYPRSTQSSPSSLIGLRTRHQDIFNQWRENGSLNEQQKNNLKNPPHRDPNVVRQHQQEVEKAQGVFDSLTQANQMQRVNERAAPPSHLARSTSERDKDLEPFPSPFPLVVMGSWDTTEEARVSFF